MAMDYADQIAERKVGCAKFGQMILRIGFLIALPIAALGLLGVIGGGRMIICTTPADRGTTLYMLRVAHARIKPYLTETDRFQDEDSGLPTMRTDKALMLALMGKQELNDVIDFYFIQDLPKWQKDRAGIDWVKGSEQGTLSDLKLLDAWGEAYYVVFDTNQDGKIPHPAAKMDRAGMARLHTQPEIPEKVFFWSSGPDRDPTTWEDNVFNW